MKAVEKKHIFYILEFNLAETKNIVYAYHDLVLITPHKDCNKVIEFNFFFKKNSKNLKIKIFKNKILQKAPNIENEHLLGLVETGEFSTLKVRIFLQTTASEDYIEQFKRSEQLTKYFGSDSMWYVQKLCNVVTLDREYLVFNNFSKKFCDFGKIFKKKGTPQYLRPLFEGNPDFACRNIKKHQNRELFLNS